MFFAWKNGIFTQKNSSRKCFLLEFNNLFTKFYAKTLDTHRQMYYIIDVDVSTLQCEVLKMKKKGW